MATPAKKVTIATKSILLDAYAQVIEEARQEYEEEKKEIEAAWKKEFDRKKEEEEYQYKKDKRARDDKEEEDLKQRYKAIDEMQEAMNEAQADIEAKADTYAELEGKVADIPALLEAAKKSAFSTAKVEIEKELNFTHQLAEAKWDADKRILENKVTALQEQSEASLKLVEALQVELKSANNRVETIATSAVTAAGNNKVTVNTAQTK